MSAKGKADYTADNITYDSHGMASFDVMNNGKMLGRFTLCVPGEHNVSNALAAIAVADFLEISSDMINQGLGEFHGTNRRFEFKGKLKDITILDDYAHHPTEIKATLNAARKYTDGRVVCIFQPHTYTRTKALFDEFVDALTGADVVVMVEIYAAREKDTLGMSSALIRDALISRGVESYYFSTFDEIENHLLEKSLPGDLLITMGAGNVVEIGEHLLGK